MMSHLNESDQSKKSTIFFALRAIGLHQPGQGETAERLCTGLQLNELESMIRIYRNS